MQRPGWTLRSRPVTGSNRAVATTVWIAPSLEMSEDLLRCVVVIVDPGSAERLAPGWIQHPPDRCARADSEKMTVSHQLSERN